MNLTDSDVKRFWSKVDIKSTEACWFWRAAILQCGGYGAFRLHGQTKRAHRIAYFLSVGNLDDTKEILHICNTPACCNPAHLVQDTHRANLQQAGREGKMTRYEGANSKVQLTQEQLKDILTSPISGRAKARKHGVSPSTIQTILKEFSVC